MFADSVRRWFLIFIILDVSEIQAMIRYLPESSAVVLKAAQIVQVRVDHVDAQDWGDQLVRPAQLHLMILDVWKGGLSRGPVVVTVTQERSDPHGFLLPPRGGWHDWRGGTGDHLVVFTSSMSGSAAEALDERSCLQVSASEDAAIDVRLADRIETEGLPLQSIVPLALRGADKLHVMFVHYLRARFAELHLEEKENLNAVLELVAGPGFATQVRATLLDAVESYISTSRATTPWHVHRLAAAMLGLLSMPEASDMRENLINTDLPSLLGLVGGRQKSTANAVFEGLPKERAAAARALNAYRGPADPKPLLEWISER
jgi:hypothetical protein